MSVSRVEGLRIVGQYLILLTNTNNLFNYNIYNDMKNKKYNNKIEHCFMYLKILLELSIHNH